MYGAWAAMTAAIVMLAAVSTIAGAGVRRRHRRERTAQRDKLHAAWRESRAAEEARRQIEANRRKGR